MILVLFILSICGTKPQSQWDKNEAEIPRLCEHPICRWTPGYNKWPHAAHRAEVPSDNSQYVIPKLPHSVPEVVPSLFPSYLKVVARMSLCCLKGVPKLSEVAPKSFPCTSQVVSTYRLPCGHEISWVLLSTGVLWKKCRYLAQNASFGPNLAVFGPKIHFFGGWME